MRDRGRLSALGNDELLAALSTISRKCHELTAELLLHLGELEERGLHLDMGFSSLFEYCTEALGFCEPTAWRRSAAAGVCRKFPEAFARFVKGDLHLSALCALRKHLTPENAAELLELCSRKSARRVDELLAARFPKPDVRDSVRRLPIREVPTFNAESEPAASVAPRLEASADGRGVGGGGNSTESPAPALHSVPGAIGGQSLEPAPRRTPATRPRLEPLSAERFGVHFTADARFMRALERARALASHRLPNGDLLILMTHGLEAYIRELEKERFGVGRKSRDAKRDPSATESSSVTPTSPMSHATNSRPRKRPRRRRRIRAVVKRQIYGQDDGQCSFVSKEGRRCSARAFIEIDHRTPVVLGGADEPDNLRLLCRSHNQQQAKRDLGAGFMREVIERVRDEKAGAGPMPPGANSTNSCVETAPPTNAGSQGSHFQR